ncbi:hypothetical protein RIF29_20648 [Crotalaria pallida]|uniref:Uncharacterized protein n=1 Tax=Crotalaria pallida TaxID=3830 RepID=A0AAN9I6I8_CROPI
MGNTLVSGTGFSSLRRLSSSEEASKPLQRAYSDAVRPLSLDGIGRIGYERKSFYDFSLPVLRPQKSAPATPSEKAGLAFAGVRSQSYSATGSRPASPSRTSVLSRVLSFVADLKKGKKGAAYIEEGHQLRLFYNRYLQWRFANARAEAVLFIQTAIVEKTLFNVWNATSSLWESVIRKRINLQQLMLELKLNSILNDQQMTYLDDWAILERDHVDSLSGAVEDLEASTLRLPLIGGATVLMVDIKVLKVAICQAVDIIKTMGSAICSLLSRVEGMNDLISEVAVVVAREKTMLDQCEVILASVATMQEMESIS